MVSDTTTVDILHSFRQIVGNRATQVAGADRNLPLRRWGARRDLALPRAVVVSHAEDDHVESLRDAEPLRELPGPREFGVSCLEFTTGRAS